MDQWLDLSDFLEHAQELIDIGLFDEAKLLLDKYEESFPDEWELYFLYSRYYAEQDRPEEAIPYLHKGLRCDPTNVDCLVGLFYAYAMMNRIAKAAQYLQRAGKHHKGSELVLAAQVWYYTETNQLQRAIFCFERLRALGNDNPETFRNGGIAYDRAGEYGKAVECFQKALDLYPGYDDARELLSDLYIATGQPEKAAGLYRKALTESPNNIRYLSRLTYCQSQTNDRKSAEESARMTIQRYPNSPIGHIDLAYVYLSSGDCERAMAAAEKANDIAPLDAESCRAKAIILSDMGKNADAESAFEKAVSLDTANSEILRDYYNHFRRTGDEKRMEEIVARVITQENSSCVEDFWFLADYYREKKNYLKSLHYLRKAYKIRPGEFDLLALVADILIVNGHAKLSLGFLRRYVEHEGWNDIIQKIAEYPELGNRPMQESLSFLRFYGSPLTDYRRHVFLKYLRQALLFSLCVIMVSAALPLMVLFGKAGLAGLASCAVVIIAGSFLVNSIRKRAALR